MVGLAVLLLVVLVGVLISYQLGAEYHRREAERAAQRRDFDQALAHLELSLEVWPHSAETQFLAARVARRGGNYEAAQSHLAKCKQLQWVPEAIALERALTIAQRDDPAEVQEYLLTCVHKDHPDSVLILEALSSGYMNTFQMHRALECLELWLQRAPDDVRALTWLGEVLDRLKRPAEAMQDYRHALDLDPAQDDVRLRLADLLLQEGQAGEATGHYEQVCQRQPGNARALLGLARCRHEAGQTEEARQLLDLVLSARPRDPEALTERGKIALNSGQLAEAEEWLHKAVVAAPFEREAVYNFAQCLERQGKHDEARPWLKRVESIRADLKHLAEVTGAISRAPRDPGPRCEAGRILLRNGHDEEGLRWLASALQLQPGHRPTHAVLAEYFERVGKPDQAARHRRLAGVAPAGSP
jgi:tetratricopeptide (TPR) repeat protein